MSQGRRRPDWNSTASNPSLQALWLRLGTPLEVCITILSAEAVANPDPGRVDMYRIPLINSKRLFWGYRLTGAVYMLQRTLGHFPNKGANGKVAPEFKDKAIQEAMRLLNCLQTCGGIVADQTGLGKTIQTLLFLALFTDSSTNFS